MTKFNHINAVSNVCLILKLELTTDISYSATAGELWSVHCEDLEKNYGVITGAYDISRGPGRNMIFTIYIHQHLAWFCLNLLIYRTTRCMCLVNNKFVFKYVFYDFVVKVMQLSWKYIYIATWYYVMGYSNFPLQKKSKDMHCSGPHIQIACI